ncbi:MAG: MBL fold metallo-hydrolase [Planctomycetota bacterium]
MTSNRLHLLALPGFAALFGAGLLTATSQDAAAVDGTPLAGSVSYLVAPRGGNMSVQTGPQGVLLVDDNFADTASGIEAAIEELGGGQLAYVLNTHWHGDHSGGNAHFATKATLLSHTNVRRRLSGDSTIGGRVGRSPGEEALPMLTYDGEMRLHFNGEEIRVLHPGPAHTDGDSIVWFTGSNVVHMGDVFFNSGYPFIDLDSGGDVEGIIEACRMVLDLVPEDARVVPGHGDATDYAGLEAYADMVEDSLAAVRRGLAEGKTGPELVEAGILDQFQERWDGGFINQEAWIRSLVQYASR